MYKRIGFLFVFSFGFFSHSVFACSCQVRSFESAYEMSAQIYLAEVIKTNIESAVATGDLPIERGTTQFRVVKKWKGDKESLEIISKSGLPGTCEKLFDFQAGEQYYFFLSGDEDQHFLSMCSLVFRSDRNSPFIQGLLRK